MTSTRLDQKLARIKADPAGAKDFILCDAKDSDMGFGLAHGGSVMGTDGRPTGRFKSRAAFLDQVRAIVAQDIVDLMLLSVSNLQKLARERVFDGSAIGTAIRANDTTDVWALRHAGYRQTPSRPFRSAELADCKPVEGRRGADIGLYSITFNNEAEADARTLQAYADFRRDALGQGLPYFLEVFNPNAARDLDDEAMPFFVNDCIVRCLAAVPEEARPKFLKVVYNGPKALEELAGYDPGVVVGVLGGSSGTTRDCLTLLRDARKYGARVALFGRKINLADDPLGLIVEMRRIADGETTPEEGVRSYHDGLARRGIRPQRELADDLAVTDPVLRSA